jgi:hypothetical protein
MAREAHVTPKERGASASMQAATAKVDALSNKLASLISASEQSMAEATVPSPAASLEEELAHLEKWCAATIEQVNHELSVARDWDNKAILATRAGRDDLAKRAIQHASDHRDTSKALRAELGLVSEAMEKLRRVHAPPTTE